MTAPAPPALDPDRGRRKDLARIHLLKRDLGLDDDSYRSLLHTLTGKTSAKDLDHKQRWRAICEMAKLAGGGPAPRPRAAEGKEPLMGKIDALLRSLGLPRSYADGIAKNMWGVDMARWCDAAQLRGLVAALVKHGQRRAAGAARAADLVQTAPPTGY
jgi:phage gp16-like protein